MAPQPATCTFSSRRAVVLIAFIVFLRCAERALSRASQPDAVVRRVPARLKLQSRHTNLPIEEDSVLLSPPPSAARSALPPATERLGRVRGAAASHSVSHRVTAGDSMQGRAPHNRPVPTDEVMAIWRAEVGGWLASHVGQREHQSGVYNPHGCPHGCGAHGRCNEHTGRCQCSSGWQGERCELEEHWECNAPDGRYLWSRCAGECDRRYGYCHCGRRSLNPQRPLLQCEPIGIELLVCMCMYAMCMYIMLSRLALSSWCACACTPCACTLC